jgi:hypothetical protein
VSGRVVIVEKSIFALPLLWKFAPNVLPQPHQNLTVKLATDDLTKGYEFLVDNSLHVEKNDHYGLDIVANRAFFGHGELANFTTMIAA